MYSSKILSAFGLRVSYVEGHAIQPGGIPSSVGQPAGMLSYRSDMRSLALLRMATWRAGNTTCATACDDGLLARLQATEPASGDDNASVIRICSIAAVSSDAGTHRSSGWVLLVDSARPLEIAISTELDLLAVLCIRRE